MTGDIRYRRNTYLYLTGKLISLLGTNIYNFAMGFFVLSLTGSGINFAITMFFSTVPRIILGPVAGVFADRVNRKKLILISDGLSGLVMIIMYFLTSHYGLRLEIIYLSSLLLTSLNTFFSVTFDASVPVLVGEERLVKVNSLGMSVSSLSNVIAPALGGFIYALIDTKLFLLFNGISFLISTIAEAFLDFGQTKKNPSHSITIETIVSDFIDGFKLLKKKRDIYMLLIGAVLFNFFYTALFIVIPVLLVAKFGMSEEYFGLVQSTFAVGILCFSLVIAYLKTVEFRLNSYLIKCILLTSLISIMSLPAIPGFTHLFKPYIVWYYSFVFFFIGGLVVLIEAPVMVYVQKNTVNQYRGRIIAMLTTLATAITPLGLLLHGALADLLPQYILILYSAVGILVVTFLIWYTLRKIIRIK